MNRTSKAFSGFVSFIWAPLMSLLLYNKKKIRLRVENSTGCRWCYRISLHPLPNPGRLWCRRRRVNLPLEGEGRVEGKCNSSLTLRGDSPILEIPKFLK